MDLILYALMLICTTTGWAHGVCVRDLPTAGWLVDDLVERR